VAGDESAVPAQNGLRTNDQERGALAGAFHGRSENSENCRVGVGDLWSADLALKNADLVAEGENLGVARVARGEHPSKSGQNQSSEDRKQGHERRTLPTFPMPETPAIAVRMSIRHPQGLDQRSRYSDASGRGKCSPVSAPRRRTV
jgi:hypothetical protein